MYLTLTTFLTAACFVQGSIAYRLGRHACDTPAIYDGKPLGVFESHNGGKLTANNVSRPNGSYMRTDVRQSTCISSNPVDQRKARRPSSCLAMC